MFRPIWYVSCPPRINIAEAVDKGGRTVFRQYSDCHRCLEKAEQEEKRQGDIARQKKEEERQRKIFEQELEHERQWQADKGAEEKRQAEEAEEARLAEKKRPAKEEEKRQSEIVKQKEEHQRQPDKAAKENRQAEEAEEAHLDLAEKQHQAEEEEKHQREIAKQKEDQPASEAAQHQRQGVGDAKVRFFVLVKSIKQSILLLFYPKNQKTKTKKQKPTAQTPSKLRSPIHLRSVGPVKPDAREHASRGDDYSSMVDSLMEDGKSEFAASISKIDDGTLYQEDLN